MPPWEVRENITYYDLIRYNAWDEARKEAHDFVQTRATARAALQAAKNKALNKSTGQRRSNKNRRPIRSRRR